MTGQQHYIKLLYKIIKCLIEMNAYVKIYTVLIEFSAIYCFVIHK